MAGKRAKHFRRGITEAIFASRRVGAPPSLGGAGGSIQIELSKEIRARLKFLTTGDGLAKGWEAAFVRWAAGLVLVLV
jgi:hypothetical protein